MATIWQTRDHRDRPVSLTDDAWAHILGRRPRMAGREVEVKEAVETPEVVTRDAGFSRRECFYRRTPSGRLWIKVVVNYLPVPPPGAHAGHVVTAFRTVRIDPKEEPAWP